VDEKQNLGKASIAALEIMKFICLATCWHRRLGVAKPARPYRVANSLTGGVHPADAS
jgi:hypothetical protein